MGVRFTGGRKGQRGYILALLLALVTVMGLMLTKAMPSVVAEVQRDAEEELIFRGESIAQAIRAYKARTGNYPLRLEDLMKLKPRLLRQLYKDPMTREGEWETVTAVLPGASGDKTGLPIVGVRSRCQKDSLKVYRNKTLISDWIFSAADDIYGLPAGASGGSSPSGDGADPVDKK